MRLFSNIVSCLFHPLLMVTYGVLLALGFTYLAIYPIGIKLFLLGGVFVSTALIPGLFILFLVKSGAASDLELTKRRERVAPYLIIITSIMVCIFYMYKMMLPIWFLLLLVGACVALLISMCINFFWKISAHCLGIGGLLGGILGVSQIHAINPYWSFIFAFGIAGLVGTARIFLKRHTPMQVYAGFCLGFMCTFASSLVSYIYLFI